MAYVYRSVEAAEYKEGVVFSPDVPRDGVAWVVRGDWGNSPADVAEEIVRLQARGRLESVHEIDPTPIAWENGQPYNGNVHWVVGLY